MSDKPPPPKLAPDQVKALGQKLEGTRRNVFDLARQMFDVEVGDDVFDQLKDVFGIGRCALCDYWIDLGWFPDKDPESPCNDCLDTDADEFDD